MPPDDLAAVLARARSHATIDVADFSALYGISKHRAYEAIRASGDEICGLKVIRVGASGGRVRIPSRPALAALGLLEDDPAPGAES